MRKTNVLPNLKRTNVINDVYICVRELKVITELTQAKLPSPDKATDTSLAGELVRHFLKTKKHLFKQNCIEHHFFEGSSIHHGLPNVSHVL
jgi:hypothetical protein